MLIRKLLLSALSILCLCVSMQGCSQNIFRTGEWFDIGMAVNAANKPSLQEDSVTSTDGQNISADGPGGHISYSSSDNLKVPEEVELTWASKR